MKRVILLMLLSVVVKAYCQNQNNTWIMGTSLGMSFSGNTMSVLPDPVVKDGDFGITACFSDPKTGKLVFYTDGKRVWNNKHNAAVNGDLINTNVYRFSKNVIIIPLHDSDYYIFSSSGYDKLYRGKVTILASGEVYIKERFSLFSAETEGKLAAVNMFNHQGHWLVTHKYNSDQFIAWPIDFKGTIGDSVVSTAGKISYGETPYINGKLFSDVTGSKLVIINCDTNPNSGYPPIIEEFTFDKKCGTVTLKHSLKPNTGSYILGYAAYSPNGRYLYTSYQITNSGINRLLQYDMFSNDPDNNMIEIAFSYNWIGAMEVAPNGKIYLATSETEGVSSKLSVIDFPDKEGKACMFNEQAIQLSRTPFPGSISVQAFPNMIHDVSDTSLYSKSVSIKIEQACYHTPTSIGLTGMNNLVADSFQWDLGDGEIVKQLSEVKHTYNDTGKFKVKFEWYVCGRTYAVVDSFSIIEPPAFSLGNDTTLCFGKTLTLSAPPGAEKYVWNTGSRMPSILVNKEGKYSVKVSSGLCTVEDKVEVNYYDQVWTALGDEYFICDDDKELVKLDAGEGFEQYKWTPTGDTSQWIIVGDLGEYFVVVKDYRGCDGSDGTKVERRCPVSVFYPNAFTPNSDGVNDVFLPVGSDVIEFTMQIYNAWGQLVFKSNELTKGWDGKVNGVPSPSGTYIYTSTYSGYRNKKMVSFEEKGNITLLR